MRCRAPLRDAIEQTGEATLHIALRPDIWAKELERRLTAPRGKQSISTFLRKALSLSPAEIGLLQEVDAVRESSPPCPHPSSRVSSMPCRSASPASRRSRARSRRRAASRSISSTRISCCARLPGVFVAGEMLDWEAPTGGYLLQACFATGAAAGTRH